MISYDSVRGSSELDCVFSQSTPAAFAAPASILDAAGALDSSSNPSPLLTGAVASSSVRPAWAMVGSVETGSGSVGCD
jgi:hypothetical protein